MSHAPRPDARRFLMLIQTQEECQFVKMYLTERTTVWREPFWALLTNEERLKIADNIKLRMVPSDGEPHDIVASDSASGCLMISTLKGLAQVYFQYFVKGSYSAA